MFLLNENDGQIALSKEFKAMNLRTVQASLTHLFLVGSSDEELEGMMWLVKLDSNLDEVSGMKIKFVGNVWSMAIEGSYIYVLGDFLD